MIHTDAVATLPLHRLRRLANDLDVHRRSGMPVAELRASCRAALLDRGHWDVPVAVTLLEPVRRCGRGGRRAPGSKAPRRR